MALLPENNFSPLISELCCATKLRPLVFICDAYVTQAFIGKLCLLLETSKRRVETGSNTSNTALEHTIVAQHKGHNCATYEP